MESRSLNFTPLPFGRGIQAKARLCFLQMMIRFSPTVAQWLTAAASGAVLSALLSLSADQNGAAPASLTAVVTTLLLATGMAMMRPPHPRWFRPLLAIPIVLAMNIDVVRGAVVDLGWRMGAHAQATATLWAFICLIGLWPTLRIAAPSLRHPLSRSASVALAMGMLLGLTQATTALAAGAMALLLADSAHPYERHHRTSPFVPLLDWSPIAAGLLLSGGWVQLRTTFDPTVSGLIVSSIGFTLGMAWMPRGLARSLTWTGTVAAALVAYHHALPQLGPSLGSFGFNATGGLPRLLWLSLPLAAWGLVCGSIVGRKGLHSFGRIALFSIALLLGPRLVTYGYTAYVAGTLLGVAALLAPTGARRGIAMASLAALVGFHGWLKAPDSAQTRLGIWANSASPQAFAEWRDGINLDARFQHGSTPDGTFVAWRPSDGEDAAITVAIDGLFATTQGNAADAEEFAAHLAAMLSPRKEPTLVLNDPAGNVLRGLAAHPPRVTHVAASVPGPIRAIASVDPVRERLWLQTNHILHPAHGARLLAMSPQPSTIIEVARAPWADSTNSAMSPAHFRTVRDRLAEDGVYALCLHTRWWPDGAPAAVARALAAQFEHVQFWAPPEGVESIILLASAQPFEANRLRSRFPSTKTALESLGFRTAEAILGSALLGTEGVQAWAESATTGSVSHRLNESIFDKPTLHAGALPMWMEKFPEPWASASSTEARQVRSARRALLSMIQAAASGQIDGTFEAAAQLSSEFGDAGQQSLEDLIAPYLRDARQALRRARAEGPESERWNDALRFVTTARMLAPKSALPLTAEGDIALARGDVPKARKKFESALGIDPKHVPALEGLARCARLTNESAQAEQALRDATRHSPRDWRTWHNLAVFFLEQGDPKEAREAIEIAIPLAGDDNVTSLLVLVTVLLAQSEAGAALLRAEQCVTEAPKNGLAWFLRGRAHYELGRWQEAEADFREAVLLDSGLIEARSGIGLVRAILGDTESATNVFRDILQRDPDNSAARENLRRLSAEKGTP